MTGGVRFTVVLVLPGDDVVAIITARMSAPPQVTAQLLVVCNFAGGG